MTTSFDVDALVVANLKGWGEAKLQRLEDRQIDCLAIAMGATERSSDSPGGKDGAITAILERKKERAKQKRVPSPLVRRAEEQPGNDDEKEEAAARLLQSTLKSRYSGVFVARHQLKILSFNSLKLRTGRAGLHEQWMAFAALMGEFDIVLMSEVPAKQAEERSKALLQLIQSCCASTSDDDADLDWQLRVSEASGPGNPEVHVAFVRSPLNVLKVQTLTRIEGVEMDHAPFQIVVEDPRFEMSKQFVLTHVHMPPSNRARDRDTQLRLLLRCYPTNSSLRSEMPFDPKAAKERNLPEVAHIVCGDFNVYPEPAEYQLESKGWAPPLIPERVSTSAGGKAYDNFILDKHAAKRCSTFSDVMELAMAQNSAMGQIGLSDHDPIVLTLKELPLVGRRSPRKVEDDYTSTASPPEFYYHVAPPTPPPPPTPVCIEAERKESDAEYKARCVARTTNARQAVASAHLVGAKPRRIHEDPNEEEELNQVQLDLQSAALEQNPKDNGKQHFVQRPELDMQMFVTGKPVLCWDTETAGLGVPAICQLAYLLVSADGSVHVYDKIWKLPQGVYMSRDATRIHGITPAAAKQGADPVNEILAFWQLAQQVLAEGGVVVGHNVSFDCRAFNCTSEKWGLTNTLEHGHMLDTMRESKRHSTLKNSRGHQKAFKNEELYNALFGYPPSWARLHNAADDVLITMLNYQQGKRKAWW